MMAHIPCVNHIINKPPLIYIGKSLSRFEIFSFLRNRLPFGQQVPIHFHGFRKSSSPPPVVMSSCWRVGCELWSYRLFLLFSSILSVIFIFYSSLRVFSLYSSLYPSLHPSVYIPVYLHSFSENIGRFGKSPAYASCSRRVALVSGPSTGLIDWAAFPLFCSSHSPLSVYYTL